MHARISLPAQDVGAASEVFAQAGNLVRLEERRERTTLLYEVVHKANFETGVKELGLMDSYFVHDPVEDTL